MSIKFEVNSTIRRKIKDVGFRPVTALDSGIEEVGLDLEECKGSGCPIEICSKY